MAFFRSRAATPDTRLLPDVVHPVIIVPGLLGTWPPQSTGKLDPMTKLYANLHDALRAVGYVPGESLFEFPFDWRLDIDSLAHVLSTYIANIRRTNLGGAADMLLKNPPGSQRPIDYSRVDIVAHSYGGVVARAYAQTSGRGSVRKLVQVSAPNVGVIAAYHAYEGGDPSFIGIPLAGAKGMIELMALREAERGARLVRTVPTLVRVARGKAEADLLDQFRNRIPAIRDLLPLARTDYIYSVDGAARTLYPFGYPENTRLERLSAPQSLAALAETDEVYTLYSTSYQTLNAVQVVASSDPHRYEHGQPQPDVPQPRAPGDTVVDSESARLRLLLSGDAAPRIKLRELDAAAFTGHSINHVQIFSDPVIVRHLTAYLLGRPDTDVTVAIWDGPTIDQRRPNPAALFL